MTETIQAARAGNWPLTARFLHWSVATGVLWQLATGRLSEAAADPQASDRILALHVEFGVLIAALILLRVLWRLGHRAPTRRIDEPAWARRAATCVHAVLYGLTIILPISGFIVWDYFDADLALFGQVPLPDLFSAAEDESLRARAWYVHVIAGWALTVLIVAHVAAALWRSVVWRDGSLRRML